jgi:hypothetical protein
LQQLLQRRWRWRLLPRRVLQRLLPTDSGPQPVGSDSRLPQPAALLPWLVQPMRRRLLRIVLRLQLVLLNVSNQDDDLV